MPAPPIILTAAMDEASFAWFDDLRRRHFPPERNVVPAHLTLFHALPGEEEQRVLAVATETARLTRPFEARVRGPWSLGRGVAFRLEAPELEAMRKRLVAEFDPWLKPQDRAPFRPHITVQNKAPPEQARELLAKLQHEFEPFDVLIRGVQAWSYLAGPWGLITTIEFSRSP